MQSPAQVRLVDPLLTDHARGYSNAATIGLALFPRVDVPVRGVKRIEFDRAAFKDYDTQRAPGTRVGHVDFGYEGLPVNLRQHALAAKTPDEHKQEAERTPGINILQRKVNLVLNVISQKLERLQAAAARNAASYDASNKTALVGADKWTDASSKPEIVLSDAAETIRARIGRDPNTLVLGAKVAKALKWHPAIRAHYRQTTSKAVSTQMLADYFDIQNVVIGRGITDDANGNSSDIWGNDAILAFVPGEGERMMELPSYGYTYQLMGHPLVEQVRWDADHRSWINDVFDEHSPELVGKDAGFLIQNAA